MRIRILALALFLALAGHFARGQTTQTLSAANQCTAPIDVTGLASLGMQMTGTWSATLQPEVAIGGQPPVNTQVTPSTSSTAQSTIAANGAYVAAVGGYTSFLVCVTAYTSGTVTIHFQGNVHVNTGLLGGGGVVTGINGGILGTEGTCAATGFAPAVGLDLLCPSSLSGPLSSHGWLLSNNGGAWQQLGSGSYPDLTDSAGVSLTSGVPFYFPVGSSGTPSISFTGHTATGFYWKSTNSICFTVGDTCDTYFSGGTVGVPSLNVFGVASSSTDASAIDTAWSRSGPGIWAAGTGAQGNETGMVRTANTQRVITSNYTNATTTPSTVVSWTGAQAFQNRNWAFYCHFVYQSSATTATLVLSINDGIAPVYEMAHARIFTTLTGTSTDATVTGTASGNLPVLTGAAPNATGTNYEAEMYGSLEDNVAGGNPFSIQAAAGGTGTVTILRGSFCALQ